MMTDHEVQSSFLPLVVEEAIKREAKTTKEAGFRVRSGIRNQNSELNGNVSFKA